MAQQDRIQRALVVTAGLLGTLIVTTVLISRYPSILFTLENMIHSSMQVTQRASFRPLGSTLLKQLNDPQLKKNFSHLPSIPKALRINEGLMQLPIGVSPYWATELREKDILSDPQNRISQSFQVPDQLKPRVRFWFDVYTRFDESKRIIHHSHYPWLVYKVVDVEPILFAKFPSRRWQRNLVADQLVARELAAIKKNLKSLVRKRAGRQKNTALTFEESELIYAIEQAGLSIPEALKAAPKNVRVQTGQRRFFASGLQTSSRYLSQMEQIFRNHRLPIELTRIPLVESSFNGEAHSKVGAVGIWQFMEGTARSMGLRVSAHLDERKAPLKATDAAARLLKENHLILGRSWGLAVTAWNHGPQGVRKAVRAVGTNDLSQIIGAYKTASFSFASENFYAEFLAALFAETYSDSTFPGLPREAPLVLVKHSLKRATQLTRLLSKHEISSSDFLKMNPDFVGLKRSAPRNKPAGVSSFLVPKGTTYFTPEADRPKLAQSQESPNPVN